MRDFAMATSAPLGLNDKTSFTAPLTLPAEPATAEWSSGPVLSRPGAGRRVRCFSSTACGWGQTPIAGRKLTVGRVYRIRVERKGYRTKRETITVAGTRPIRRNYVLERETRR